MRGSARTLRRHEPRQGFRGGSGELVARVEGQLDDTHTPLTGTLVLLVEPEQGYRAVDALASPRHELDLTMYELPDPEAEQILAADAHRGVRVRVLFDRDYIGRYNRAGLSFLLGQSVAVRWASDQVAITHEKTSAIDRRTAVVMTGNLTSEYYSTSRDFAVVDSIPADVAAIEQTFGL